MIEGIGIMGHLPRAVLFIFFLAVFTLGHFSANAQVATLPVASAGQPAPGFEEEGATFHNFFGHLF